MRRILGMVIYFHVLVLIDSFFTLSQLTALSGNVETKLDPKLVQLTSLLTNLWGKVANPDTFGEVDFVLDDYGLTRRDVGGFINHFQTCRDCAAEGAFLSATQNIDKKYTLRLSNVHFAILTEDSDDSDWRSSENDDEHCGSDQDNSVFPSESNDDIVIRHSKEWVTKGLLCLIIAAKYIF